jgi:DNA modification methylase
MILVGDALACLRAMPSDSVHCVVTSPPYWGLRDYGVPPQIWGGAADCRHEWQSEIVAAYSSKGNWQQAANGKQLATGVPQTRHKGDLNSAREVADSKIERAFCQRCNAWRGVLGLEPDYRLYVDHLVAVLREVRRVLRPTAPCG